MKKLIRRWLRSDIVVLTLMDIFTSKNTFDFVIGDLKDDIKKLQEKERKES